MTDVNTFSDSSAGVEHDKAKQLARDWTLWIQNMVWRCTACTKNNAEDLTMLHHVYYVTLLRTVELGIVQWSGVAALSEARVRVRENNKLRSGIEAIVLSVSKLLFSHLNAWRKWNLNKTIWDIFLFLK